MEPEMKRKPSVLFIIPKWCECNPNYGSSEYESNFVGSLESSGLATYETFHLDEFYHTYQEAGDVALLRKCMDSRPDMVFMTCFPTGHFPYLPSLQTLEIIQHQLKIPIVAAWGDLYYPSHLELSRTFLPFVEFNVVTGSSAVLSRVNQRGKYMYFWCPKDPRYFHDPGMERDIPLSFVGSVRRSYRQQAIDALHKCGIDVYQTGGEREQHLPVKQYAQIFMRSKIALSFCRSWHSIFVINARTFEATLCGAMLLEEEGFETAKLFTPFVDYVPYSSMKDLVEKAKYYLEHDRERQKIADSGCKKAREQYSAERFWQIVLNRALKSTNSEPAFDGNTFELTPERLSKLPLSRSLKLRLLNYAYSNVAVYTSISDLQRIPTLVKWPFTIISSYVHSAKRFLRTVKRLVKK